MKNCIIAQSGGPTSVINSSVIGLAAENLSSKYFDNVYAGVNGIEGILNRKIINLSSLSMDELETFRYTPSSGLGSCRYKMKNYKENDSEYKRLFEILDEMSIDAFFYVGGNDSMDTVAKLNEYAEMHSIKKQIIGIPKTIDNDLVKTDHTPGFGSAAKLISTITLESYLDSSVYINNGVFILETMGRDTGWLAASAALAMLDGKPVADFIYLPEVTFSKEDFLRDVGNKFKEQNQVYIVASEGIKDEDGNFLSEIKIEGQHDSFGHAQLGGVCSYLKNLIKDSGITSRVKTLELGVIQRCAMHAASQTDLDEAYAAGKAALNYAKDGISGYMVGIKRVQNDPYISENFLIKANEVCNNIKYFPVEWINESGNHVTSEAIDYIRPLVIGHPGVKYENGLPKFITVK
jgi:ATP-dependent phosphofructokinase / diphosphate-dependent phosphofructokinase